MSVKYGLLALLSEGPHYGAWLRSEFESRTGGTWPLNVGQVYTTLTRMERDGLIAPHGSQGEDGTLRYAITAAGLEDLRRWWADPVDRTTAPRDELAIKLSLALTLPGVDLTGIIQTQRRATITRLQSLTQLKRGADPAADLAWELVLDNLIFTAEAEARWLDHVEARLAAARPERATARRRGGAPAGSAAADDTQQPAASSSPGGRDAR